MNIGDKVRLVHGKEEGIVYAFLPGNVVEIEIEDGFRIPVLKSEVVTISPVEQQRLIKPFENTISKPESEVFRPNKPFSEKGIYLAFVSVNDKTLTVHLVNNTDWIVPYTAIADHGGQRQGLEGGALQARGSQKLTELQSKDFEIWPAFEFNFLFYRAGNYSLPAGLTKRLKCKAQSFYKNKKLAPVINKEAFVYQLDEENLKIQEMKIESEISAKQIQESMMRGSNSPSAPIEEPNHIVDLHIERLTIDFAKLSKEEIARKQINAFELNLDQAIAAGMQEITFIHGVGNGTLRDELHKRLSKNTHVEYFRDAQKEKFGYGATLVKIK